MFTKHYPFFGSSTGKLFQSISTNHSNFYNRPWLYSNESYDFISKMLKSLLVIRITVKQALNHEFIKKREERREETGMVEGECGSRAEREIDTER